MNSQPSNDYAWRMEISHGHFHPTLQERTEVFLGTGGLLLLIVILASATFLGLVFLIPAMLISMVNDVYGVPAAFTIMGIAFGWAWSRLYDKWMRNKESKFFEAYGIWSSNEHFRSAHNVLNNVLSRINRDKPNSTTDDIRRDDFDIIAIRFETFGIMNWEGRSISSLESEVQSIDLKKYLQREIQW